MCKRVLLFVIDGLGVGEMPDVHFTRKNDIGANTLKSILSYGYEYDFFNKVNLFSLLDNNYKNQIKDFKLISGKSCLEYDGADSYLGHCEMIGRNEKISPIFLENYIEEIYRLFYNAYTVKVKSGYISLSDTIYISNNMECDPGYSINILFDTNLEIYLDQMNIANSLMKIMPVSRILLIYGCPISKQLIDNSIIKKEQENILYCGISIPKLEIYNENYKVYHVGRITKDKNDLINKMTFQNYDVSLLGKPARLFDSENCYCFDSNNTDEILIKIKERWQIQQNGLIFANVQDVDLGGHEENVLKCAKGLKKINDFFSNFIYNLKKDDLVIITADHGNDPLIGHMNHTREYTPVLIFGQRIKSQNIGVIKSLNYINDTIRNYFELS